MVVDFAQYWHDGIDTPSTGLQKFGFYLVLLWVIMTLLCTLVPMKDGFLFGTSLPPLYGFLEVPITHNVALQTILYAFICLLKTRHPKRAFYTILQTKIDGVGTTNACRATAWSGSCPFVSC